MKKKTLQDIIPLMASASTTSDTPTSARRNIAGTIERTERFHNIDYGLVPFKYSNTISNKSSLNVRDAVILCQKAYYNFAIFRNTIDLMTEFSCSNIYFRDGSQKSRDFFTALFKNSLKPSSSLTIPGLLFKRETSSSLISPVFLSTSIYSLMLCKIRISRSSW